MVSHYFFLKNWQSFLVIVLKTWWHYLLIVITPSPTLSAFQVIVSPVVCKIQPWNFFYFYQGVTHCACRHTVGQLYVLDICWLTPTECLFCFLIFVSICLPFRMWSAGRFWTLTHATVYLLTSSLLHHLQHSVRNWKHTYSGNHTQTLFCNCFAIVVLEVIVP